MKKTRLLVIGLVALAAALISATPTALAAGDDTTNCRRGSCPHVDTGSGSLVASYFERAGSIGYASNSPPAPQPYRWRLRTPCEIDDQVVGGCAPGQNNCTGPSDRVITYYIVQAQRLVLPDRSIVDGLAPPPGIPVGKGFGQWSNVYAGCVDVTDLNPPPSPDEVYRYFRTLPLPQLATRQQPPGNALV